MVRQATLKSTSSALRAISAVAALLVNLTGLRKYICRDKIGKFTQYSIINNCTVGVLIWKQPGAYAGSDGVSEHPSAEVQFCVSLHLIIPPMAFWQLQSAPNSFSDPTEGACSALQDPVAGLTGALLLRVGQVREESRWRFWDFQFGGSGEHGFELGAFNRNNYRSPTTNYTMQVFGSDAQSQIRRKIHKTCIIKSLQCKNSKVTQVIQV